MLDKAKLQETAMQVKDLGTEKVADWADLPPRKVARFVTKPESVTFVELEKIRRAIAQLQHTEGCS